MSITELSIKRPALVIVVFTVLGILGLLSYSQLNYNLLPKFEAPVMSVITIYPGAAAGEVETSVTKKVEDALSSLENLDKIQSTSQEGVSLVVIQLLQSANVDEAVQEAQRKVNAILSQLPDDVEAPTINKFSTDDLPILQMGVSANVSPTIFYKMVEDRIQPQLAKIQGVGQITLVGGEERQIKVNLDPAKLEAYNLSLNQITQTIINSNQDFPTGKVETTDQQYSLRIAAKFTSLDQLRSLVVANRNGSRITLGDVAEVEDGIAEITTINRINGRPSIGLIVRKQADANAVDVSKKLKAEIVKIEKMYTGEKLKFNIANDNSTYTLASANAVQEDLILAVIIVAAVMLIFLHSLRSSLIVMVAIPASMISTFILMYLFDFSLNLMTLMALSLVVGILVDDSIVVLENIYRHMEMGKDKRTAALDGRNEIGFTALAITLVDVVVFLPMSLVSGLIGNILREFALVVVFSTLMSLFVSFTITPMLASRFGKLDHFTKETLWGRISLGFESLFTSLQNAYTRILRWSLGHRWAIYLLAFALFVGSIALVPAGFIGSEFTAQGDRGEMVIQLELEPQVTMYQNNQTTRQVEQLLMAQPEVKLVQSKVGYSSTQMGAGTGSNNRSELTVVLVDKKDRNVSTEQFGVRIKEQIQKFPGVKAKAAATSITGNANVAPIQIVLKGTELEKVREAANLVLGVVKQIPGTTDVEFSVEDPNPELQVKLDRERMAALGLSVADIGGTLRTAFNGNDDSKYRDGQYEYDIHIALDEFNRTNSEDVSNITFVNNQGKPVALKQFATVSQELGASKLERRDRLSAITVNSQVIGRPVGTVGADIQKVMATKQLPEGIIIEYAGSLQQQSDAFGSLGIALVIAIVFVYLIMVALYDSFLYPFIVLFSLPVALIGALMALALALENLSIFSIIGMIMLMGLVAKNAILLVDFTNHLKEQGMPVREALIEAGRERLRPILMTTIAMIFGMLPIAIASGAGAETKNGLAWVIIGGLTSSLLLTLVLVPSAYLTFELAITKIKKRFGRGKQTEAVATVPSLSDEKHS